MQNDQKHCYRCNKNYQNYLRYCDCIDLHNHKTCEKCVKIIENSNWYEFIINNKLYCNKCWIIINEVDKDKKKNLQEKINELTLQNEEFKNKILLLESKFI